MAAGGAGAAAGNAGRGVSGHSSRCYLGEPGGGITGRDELGYIEGQNVGIEFRWAETPVQLPEFAAELAKAEVAVIIAGGNALARAGKSATSKIPILFVIADDPVRLGFVESFKRPGGNNDRGEADGAAARACPESHRNCNVDKSE
jgi:hypothetical protein